MEKRKEKAKLLTVTEIARGHLSATDTSRDINICDLSPPSAGQIVVDLDSAHTPWTAVNIILVAILESLTSQHEQKSQPAIWDRQQVQMEAVWSN